MDSNDCAYHRAATEPIALMLVMSYAVHATVERPLSRPLKAGLNWLFDALALAWRPWLDWISRFGRGRGVPLD